MFREMRRMNQALSTEECIQALNRGTSGVLAVSGDEDYPYAVPLSFVYLDHHVFFHCAVTGHKLESIARNDKVSFCVIDKDQVVPEDYNTYYRSVIIFGRARIMEDREEKRKALDRLVGKYSPDLDVDRRTKAIAKNLDDLCIIDLAVEHMTGKESVELSRAKRHE
jgi:nitroimidazol reductase NimA-like FMN-containing flavoprotein (pyridoxamine 5'-phosphate oxidase superfamily)